MVNSILYNIFLVLMQLLLLIKLMKTFGFRKAGVKMNQDNLKMLLEGYLSFFIYYYYLIKSYVKAIKLNLNNDIAWNYKGLSLYN